jgi:hypothetical protein
MISLFGSDMFADGYVHYKDWNRRTADVIVKCFGQAIIIKGLTFCIGKDERVLSTSIGDIDGNSVWLNDGTLTRLQCFVFDLVLDTRQSGRIPVTVHWAKRSDHINRDKRIRLQLGDSMRNR